MSTSTFRSFDAARAQAAEFLGFAASVTVKAGDRTFEIPNPNLLDDDQQDRYDALKVEMETWDKDEDGTTSDPARKAGKLVQPSYNKQLAAAILGDEYDAFLAAGGRSSDVALHWWQMNVALRERQLRDAKSAGGAGAVAGLS